MFVTGTFKADLEFYAYGFVSIISGADLLGLGGQGSRKTFRDPLYNQSLVNKNMYAIFFQFFAHIFLIGKYYQYRKYRYVFLIK